MEGVLEPSGWHGREWARLVQAVLDCLHLYRVHFCEIVWASDMALSRALWRVGKQGGPVV